MRKKTGFWSVATSVAVVLLTVVPPAAADHTNPRTPLAPTTGPTATGITHGAGTWQHVANIPGLASEALTGGGTDLQFWAAGVYKYGAFGTLGQDNAGSVGQRVVRLTTRGQVTPQWIADHGSAHCETSNPSGTLGLQHDSQIAARNGIRLLTDTTDATGRCHDPNGGGIEIVDVTNIENPAFQPREVHLVRLAGLSHTHTVDAGRRWIVYNSSSDFADRPWIDVLDLRSCHVWGQSLAQRRAACRPAVYRIRFQDNWTKQRDQDTGQLEPGSAACHDITYGSANRLYCATPNATLILDMTGMFTSNGGVRGTRLPCTVVPGTRTSAMVTDCSANGAGATQGAVGWKFLGTFNHPGRDCAPKPIDNRNCNSNNHVRSDEGVAVAHEADPTPDGRFMFVTDERGGGVVPPGSSCGTGVDNPFGNGGAHAFDIRNPSNIQYARKPDGSKAVFIGDAVVPATTFCDIHVIEHVPGEQRFLAAYYTQGIKIVDYFVDAQNRVQFRETASLTLPNANTWGAEQFKVVSNANGTVTYSIATNDIQRGIDIVTWTGPKNPIGAPPPASGSSTAAMNVGLVGLALLLLPAAAAVGRRRQRQRLDED